MNKLIIVLTYYFYFHQYQPVHHSGNQSLKNETQATLQTKLLKIKPPKVMLSEHLVHLRL